MAKTQMSPSSLGPTILGDRKLSAFIFRPLASNRGTEEIENGKFRKTLPPNGNQLKLKPNCKVEVFQEKEAPQT